MSSAVVAPPADVTAPAWWNIAEHVDTAGPEVVDFGISCGIHLDPAQVFVIDAMYAETRDGKAWRPAASEFGLVGPRQQIKTYPMQAACLADVFYLGQSVVWTAHRMRTTTKAFNFILDRVTNYDHLRRRVKRINLGKGEEYIETLTGATFEFLARTEMGGRGFTGNKLVIDEALACTPGMIGTQIPIMTAMPEWQIRYLSSPGKGVSSVLRGIRDRGRVGAPRLTYLEWGDRRPPECEHEECTHEVGSRGCYLDDEPRMRNVNVGQCAGRTPNEPQRALRAGLPPEEFAREFMGQWDDESAEASIDPATWGTLTDDTSRIVGSEHFALDVSPRRSWAAITVAGRNGDARWHVEITSRQRAHEHGDLEQVLAHRPGTSWVVTRFVQLKKRFPRLVVHILAGSAAESLVKALKKAGVDVAVLPATQFAAACGHMQDVADTDDLRHLGQPTRTRAVHATGAREIAEKARVWTRRGGKGDTTPMWSGTLALYAAYEADGADYDVLDSVH